MEGIFGASLDKIRNDLASSSDPSTFIPLGSPTQNSYGHIGTSYKEALVQQGIDLAVNRVNSFREASSSNVTGMSEPLIFSDLSKAKYVSTGDDKCACAEPGSTTSVSGHNNASPNLASRAGKYNSNDANKNKEQTKEKAPDAQGENPFHIKVAADIPCTKSASVNGTEPIRNLTTENPRGDPSANSTAANNAPQPHLLDIPDLTTIFHVTSIEIEKAMREALKIFGDVHDLSSTTDDNGAQTQSATATNDTKLSEAQAASPAKDPRDTEVSSATVTKNTKNTEDQPAATPRKTYKVEVESVSDSDEEGGMPLEVDEDDEEWEMLDAARVGAK
ncbi:hypothetical protein AOQ84DRAFT_357017 [Glonium stellatum]|uniref:Uncharacterized protein n=1 Tax=Glonium stellatum TaxID=574774 RepID=A0A8E2ER20_9PEZI|nr:hypothetical protein AOQ84DRAFT_357017 [Glonium stellatum]